MSDPLDNLVSIYLVPFRASNYKSPILHSLFLVGTFFAISYSKPALVNFLEFLRNDYWTFDKQEKKIHELNQWKLHQKKFLSVSFFSQKIQTFWTVTKNSIRVLNEFQTEFNWWKFRQRKFVPISYFLGEIQTPWTIAKNSCWIPKEFLNNFWRIPKKFQKKS